MAPLTSSVDQHYHVHSSLGSTKAADPLEDVRFSSIEKQKYLHLMKFPPQLILPSHDDAALRFSGHQACFCKGMIKICKMHAVFQCFIVLFVTDLCLHTIFWRGHFPKMSVLGKTKMSKICGLKFVHKQEMLEWLSNLSSCSAASFQMCSKIVGNGSQNQDTYGIPRKYQ